MTNTLLFAKITWGAILLWFEFFTKPTFSLMGVVFAVIAIDLITGIVKSVFKKIARTSQGYRKTITKLMQYIIPVLILWGAGNYIPEYKLRLEQASGFVMLFIIYIEVTSIFENLYEIDNKSPISRYLYKYALVVLKFGLEHNPVQQAAENIKVKVEETVTHTEQTKTTVEKLPEEIK